MRNGSDIGIIVVFMLILIVKIVIIAMQIIIRISLTLSSSICSGIDILNEVITIFGNMQSRYNNYIGRLEFDNILLDPIAYFKSN